jgi:ornithine cyclodeaminase
MKIITLEQIQEVVSDLDLVPAIEEGFIAYSEGRATVPPVGELLLERGEVHIKYGYIKGEEYYVIKIASGFSENQKLGLPTGNGMMLLFSQMTGELISILLDEGFLTELRTALAGAIAAKYLAPSKVNKIGMVGTGMQARLQLIYLKTVNDCRDVLAWGRNAEKMNRYKTELEEHGFNIEITRDVSRIMKECNLIVTATSTRDPILPSAELQPGTHITAMGSDTPEKQELDPDILKKADLVVADSIPQCLLRGEIFKAIRAGVIREEELAELGSVISRSVTGRTSDNQISVADLTGVAVQDIKIATAVYQALFE